MRRGRWRESKQQNDWEDETEQRSKRDESDGKGKGMRIAMATETIGGDG